MSVSEYGSSIVSTSREGSPMSNIANGGSQDSGVCVYREGRRPSIAEMISSGELLRLQGDSADRLDLSGVPVNYVEQIYNDFEPPGSISERGDGAEGGHGCYVDEHVPDASCFRSRRWRNVNSSFGSPIIASYWKKKVIEFLRRRYKIAVSFIGLFALVWIVFFSVYLPFPPSEDSGNLAYYSVRYSQWYIIGAVILLICMLVLLGLTFSRHYPKCAFVLSIVLAFILMVCSWVLPIAMSYNEFRGVSTVSFVAQFGITALVILVMYTLSRLPLWLSTVLALMYIIILEVLISTVAVAAYENYVSLFHLTTASRCLFYLCLIVSGLTTAYLSQVRLWTTFRKIAQCVLSEKALELEKQLAETTILTMMPKPFADELCRLDVQLTFMLKQQADQQQYMQQSSNPWLQSIPTPFTVRSVDNVSILFADIVGFTQLSSNMKAFQLVGILNDIFSKFDDLVTEHHCEKVSTLGDSYFCVSGCPEPQAKHADNCVHMGLAIVDVLKEFCSRESTPIEMRIGIHTGSVLCGVMGSKRFKFDVWSKDVSIANRIESLCLPGHTLISEATKSNLQDSYILEELHLSNPVTLTEQLRLFTVLGLHSEPPVVSNREEYRTAVQVDALSELELQRPPPQACQPEALSRLVRLCCPGKQNDVVELELNSIHHSDSIVDIFSRQFQIQQCRSYAEQSVGTTVQEATSDSDRRIVQLMEEGNVDFENYFNRYLKLLSLHFHDSNLENSYHNLGRDLDDGSGGEMAKLSLHLSRCSYLMDTCALFFIFVMVMVGTAITLFSDKEFIIQLFSTWIALFLFGVITEVTVICHVIVVFRPNWFPSCLVKYVDRVFMNWYVRSFIALFFIYYPMAAVFVSVSHCSTQGLNYASVTNLTYVQTSLLVTIVVLVSSILFMDISHIAKMIGGVISCVISVVMISYVQLKVCSNMHNVTSVPPAINNYYTRHLAPESVVLLFLILIILTVVNRMSEVSVRVSFLGCVVAAARRRGTRQLKSQAEWLLHNIIPPRVAHRLREVGHFSQNHECVGVLFASIVNFNEYYQQRGETEESYRVLNRIVSKFDSLLDLPHFQSVEKIKTIGSTYMAASGLNVPEGGQCGVDHLVTLIDFAIQLEEVLKTINHQIVGFSFSLRVGFNYGPVTSGVVGRRKMLYDIWGDAVNVASRMETTGQKGRIQMPEHCLTLLRPYIVQVGSRTVPVKGKGNMTTVFVTRCS